MNTKRNFRRLYILSSVFLFALVAFREATPVAYGQSNLALSEHQPVLSTNELAHLEQLALEEQTAVTNEDPYTSCIPSRPPQHYEPNAPGLFYATDEQRTLLRWYWDDCTTATFHIFRQVGSGPETFLAEVTPVSDPVAAESLLNSDPNWPHLSAKLQRLMESTDQFKGIPEVTGLPRLFNFMYVNSLAGRQWGNQYYPAAAMLGQAYLDEAIEPGENYRYRVVAIGAGDHGQDIEIGQIEEIVAGQRTPLPSPPSLTAIDLADDPEAGIDSPFIADRAGDWGKAQRNRRYDGQIYLIWELPEADIEAFPNALTTGYDVFELEFDASGDTIISGQRVPGDFADDPDQPISLGPLPDAAGDPPYNFRYEPKDYDEHLLCVGPRDLLNQTLRWPDDAAQCSPHVTVQAYDFIPPSAPIRLNVVADHTAQTIMLDWTHAQPEEVDDYVVQRTYTLQCTAETDCWQDVARLRADQFLWTDPAPGCFNHVFAPVNCWYQVMAVDSSGNRSVPAGPKSALIYDEEPPELLLLDDYECTDQNSFNVGFCVDIVTNNATTILLSCSFTEGGEELLITTFDGDEIHGLELTSQITDIYQPPLTLDHVVCHITLADEYGNLQYIADEDIGPFRLDSDKPQLAQPIITNLNAGIDEFGQVQVTLYWDTLETPVLGGFNLYRNGIFVVSVSAGQRIYIDKGLEEGQEYEYVVEALHKYDLSLNRQSEPRRLRTFVNPNRAMVELDWDDLEWQEAEAAATLAVDASPVAEGSPEPVVHYAVFRSLDSYSNFIQITPILEDDQSIEYDDLAQNGCYTYVVITFRERDGEPNGYTVPRSPEQCVDSVPESYTPGPDVAPPPYPNQDCVAAAQTSTRTPFTFGGGFEVVVERLTDDGHSSGSVSGEGSLQVETLEETLSVPLVFSGLTVNKEGFVCSGTAVVDLTGLPNGGLHLQDDGGWRYRVRSIQLQPWFGSQNHALATVDLYPDEAFTNVDQTGLETDSLELTDVHLTNNLRFERLFLPAPGDPSSCTGPGITIRLETLPLDFKPTGLIHVDEFGIQIDSAQSCYHDRFNGAYMLQGVTHPYPGQPPTDIHNDGFLRADYNSGPVTITPEGLNGTFSTSEPLDWTAAYPYAFHMHLNDGLSFTIADNHIQGGTAGAGFVEIEYQQSTAMNKQTTRQATFDSLQIDPNGAFYGQTSMDLTLPWDAFRVLSGSWEIYLGPITTPSLPATNIHQSIMWTPRPGDVIELNDGEVHLSAELEPGLNRRLIQQVLNWNNCGYMATFNGVVMDTYLRRSGVSQWHIPVFHEGDQFEIHGGYHFLPERFDLNFLDNDLYTSDIRGFVDLPFPSNILIHLVEIWLTADLNNPTADAAASCIGGGRIPEGERDFLLEYWALQTYFTSAEFRQTAGAPTLLWLLGELRELPHLKLGSGPEAAVIPAELAFNPDGSRNDHPESGPKYNQPDFHFQGMPYLLSNFDLSMVGEDPSWDENATVIAPPSASTWDNNGFIGLKGMLNVPYFGPMTIEAGEDQDEIIFTVWDETLTGLASQPSVSREWVDLPRLNITFQYEQIVYSYDAATGNARFVGFQDYRFVPDHYLDLVDGPDWLEEQTVDKLQILQLDTSTVIEPGTTGVYLGLSSGVAGFRALAQSQQLGLPDEDTLRNQWAIKLGMSEDQARVYAHQFDRLWDEQDPFDYTETTEKLDQLSDEDIQLLLDEDYVGGRTQGLLADKGVNFRRLRGVVEVEGEGMETQFTRFVLSLEAEIKGQNQEDTVNIPSITYPQEEQEEPAAFYAKRMTLSIVRHGDITVVGQGIESSKFKEKLDQFDAMLSINTTEGQFEGGITLYGLKLGAMVIDNGSAVLGVGNELNYLGLSFDGTLSSGYNAIDLGGDALFGVVDTNSDVLKFNFADTVAEIEDDLDTGTGFVGGIMTGFYARAYLNKLAIIDQGCLLNLKADAEVAMWLFLTEEAGFNLGGQIEPAVYGEVACVMQARGDLRLEYQYVGDEHHFNGEGYIAAGIGKCDPSSWAEWSERWWGDSWCLQAGAYLEANYTTNNGWQLDAEVDAEGIN